MTVLPPMASGTGTRRIQPAGTDPSSARAGDAPPTHTQAVSTAAPIRPVTLRRVRATTPSRLCTGWTVPSAEPPSSRARPLAGRSDADHDRRVGMAAGGAWQRSAYLDGCRAVIETARATPGCLDFSLAADLIDDDRINIFEQWESVDAVERFRGSGPSDDQQAVISGAHVVQHTVTDTVELS